MNSIMCKGGHSFSHSHSYSHSYSRSNNHHSYSKRHSYSSGHSIYSPYHPFFWMSNHHSSIPTYLTPTATATPLSADMKQLVGIQNLVDKQTKKAHYGSYFTIAVVVIAVVIIFKKITKN